MPAIHAILLVRDEADILPVTLPHLLSFCDTLSIIDNGSADATWDLLCAAAAGERRVMFLERDAGPAHLHLRGRAFEALRGRGVLREGDWVLRADADEVYHADVPRFLREGVGPREGRVFSAQHQFVITRAQAAAMEATGTGLDLPLERRVTRYVPDATPEPRFFRYRRGMRWNAGHSNPLLPGLPARERVPVRHYRWRSPEQMRRRCALRASEARRSAHGTHWQIEDWRRWLEPDDAPYLRTWSPDTPGAFDEDALEHAPPLVETRLARARRAAVYCSGLVRVIDRWPAARGVDVQRVPGASVGARQA